MRYLPWIGSLSLIIGMFGFSALEGDNRQAVVQTQTPVVLVPSYTAAYSVEQSTLLEILKELKAIRLEILALRGMDMPPPTFSETVKARCASCHGEAEAKAKGNEFVLLLKDGKLPPFSLREKRRIEFMVSRGLMPPKGGLDEAERKVMIEGLKEAK